MGAVPYDPDSLRPPGLSCVRLGVTLPAGMGTKHG